MQYMVRAFLSLLIVLTGGMLRAQTMELGLSAGGAGYIGDLNQDRLFKLSGFSAGAYVKMNLDPYWAVGLHYTYGKIRANDADSHNEQFRNRNLNFRTPLNEISLQVDFNFFEYFAGGGRRIFSPYIFTGVGTTLFNPSATYNGMDYKLRYYLTEGQGAPYKNYTFAVPYGAGVKVRLKENWGMFAQAGYRTSYSDYLDDVRGRYPNESKWPENDSPELRATRLMLSDPSGNPYRPELQRGDLRKRDTYMFVGIGISYTFVSQKCYTF